WLTLDDEVKPLLAAPAATDDRELLRQTVALAHFTTLAISLAQGEAGFASFDAGIAQPPRLVAKRPAAADILSLTSSGAPRPKRPLAKSQQRDLMKSIES